MISLKKTLGFSLLASFLFGLILLPASPIWGATASVDVLVRGDGGVEVTVSGSIESCTYCNFWGECWFQDRGSVSLSKGNRVLCSAEGRGWASCGVTLDRGDLHGVHVFDGSATDCLGSVATRYTSHLDNTPSLDIASPADGGVLSGPFDVTARAAFKPTLNPIKGKISFYLGNNWYPLAEKACLEEVCAFSYQELKGSLLDFYQGGPYRIHMYATVPGAQASGQVLVTMDKKPELKISSPGNGSILSEPFDVTATATFKPTLDPVKGEITLYIGNNYAPSARKECKTETCAFSYRELTGQLLDFYHGGPYKIHMYATVPGAQSSDQVLVTMDKTPTVKIFSPEGILSSPFDVTGTATFKPTQDRVKGTIRLYLNNNWSPSAAKECLRESCSFSYGEVMGSLLSLPPGGPHRARLYAQTNGATAYDEKTFTLVPCNLRAC